MGGSFGSRARPLLVSVRSGARASMPGMMDTVLNLGLNDETVAGLIEKSGDERFAWDTFRRFIHMYGRRRARASKHELVRGELDELKHARRVRLDTELAAKDLEGAVQALPRGSARDHRRRFPGDPFEQLRGAIAAVFRSWNTPRAETYRKLNNIPHEWGTAGQRTGDGVRQPRRRLRDRRRVHARSRRPASGASSASSCRQRAGRGRRRRHPHARSRSRSATRRKRDDCRRSKSSCRRLPRAAARRELLEKHYARHAGHRVHDPDAASSGCCRRATASAPRRPRVKIAVDMAEEGADRPQDGARCRVEPGVARPAPAPDARPNGRAAVDRAGPAGLAGRRRRAESCSAAEDAEAAAERGESVILVRTETSPEDIHGMHAAQRHPDRARRHDQPRRGGRARHGHVPCVAGAARRCRSTYERARDPRRRDDRSREGDVDHHRRLDRRGRSSAACRRCQPTLLERLRDADGLGRRAPPPARARQRRHPGRRARARAQLRRRGHRPVPHRAHVLRGRAHLRGARDDPGRDATERAARALAEILPMQREDFVGIFRAMDGAAGDDPPARPAAARVPAARPATRWRGWPRDLGRAGELRLRRRSQACASSTRCSATAAAGSASPIPRSTRCRCARSSRRRLRDRADRGCARSPRSCSRSSPAVRELASSCASSSTAPRKAVMEESGKDGSATMVGTMIELPRAAIVRRPASPRSPSSSRSAQTI